jgi:hypothetical protein
MKRKSELARQLDAISPKLWEVEPSFKVPDFKRTRKRSPGSTVIMSA